MALMIFPFSASWNTKVNYCKITNDIIPVVNRISEQGYSFMKGLNGVVS